MAGHFVEPAMLIPQILICSLLFGFDCYCERKATIKPHGIQCAFLRMLTQIYLFAAQYILDSMFRKWGKRYEALTQQRIPSES